MRVVVILLWVSIVLLGYSTCNEMISDTPEQDGKPFLFPDPIASLKPTDSIFTFLAEDGFSYSFFNGSEIHIPARAFIKPDGSLVNGEIELSFTFYKDALDLFLDGVLMDHSLERKETSGGFSISARQGRSELLLDPSQLIRLRLACYSKAPDYVLNQYNDHLQVWDSIQMVKQEINEERIVVERRHNRNRPNIQFPLNEQYFALNYTGILDVLYNGDYTNIHHQRTQDRMEAYGLRWTKVEVDSTLDYSGQKQEASSMVWKNISRKRFPEWTDGKQGTLKWLKSNRYRLQVEEHDKVFSTQVEAVMPLENLFSSGPGYWKKNYEKKLAGLDRVDQLLESMPHSYRTFGIYELGIYQWQKPRELLDEDVYNISVQFKKPFQKDIESYGLYWLSDDLLSLEYYPSTACQSIPLALFTEGRFFSVTTDQRIINVPQSQIDNLDFTQLRKMNRPAVLLEASAIERLPWNKKQLIRLLYSL